jgi:hypothetical protein
MNSENHLKDRFLNSCSRVRYRQATAFWLLFWLKKSTALAQTTTGLNSLNQFIDPLKNGLNLIMVFGFIAGCVMVMGGFLNAKRDESWKMTVIYGLGVAGAVALMKALFSMFSGEAGTTVQGF